MASPLDWLQQMLGGSMGEMPEAAPRVPDALSQLGGYLENSASNLARIPGGIGRALDWAGNNVAAPALGQMADLYEKDQLGQPLYGGVNEQGEVTGRLADLGAALMPYLAGGAPGGSLGAGIKMPNIGKGTDAPLFDLSRITEIPDMPQGLIARSPTPPKGIPSYTTALNNDATRDRMIDYFNLGMNKDLYPRETTLGWYNTMPLRERFVSTLGPEEGHAAWQRYIDYVAASSPQNRVRESVRTASYLYGLDRRGEPLPSGYAKNEKGNWAWTSDEAKPPSPYGGLPLWFQNALAIRERGGMDPFQNPKPPSFGANLKGNYAPLTIDLHNMRALGSDRDVPGTGSYGYLEEMQRPWAEKMGVPPAQWQSSVWIGGGKDTGLKSVPEPWLSSVDWNVRRTADDLGLTPDATLDRFIRGELLGFK